ncbi:MAG: hypothetical protein JMDDDDMK_05211 [Acidobacteria bacterium]|nr:hypothetical protein [Acidobacteriota bacterium]
MTSLGCACYSDFAAGEFLNRINALRVRRIARKIAMLSQSTLTSQSQSRRKPMVKPRFLIVCDSVDRLKRLRSPLNTGEAEITCVSSLQELDQACHSEHDLAIVDMQPAQIRGVLKTLRSSAEHAMISLLVEASRLVTEPGLAGVLPKYRAMPCSYSELLQLARQLINPLDRRRNGRELL